MNKSHKNFCRHHGGYLGVILCFFLVAFSICAPSPGLATKPANPVREDLALAAGLVPHKALYDIKLISTRSGAQIINISGQMFYDWKPACDAWISNHRFNLFYEYSDSPPMRITSDFSTYETFDGNTMNFTSQRKRDGRLFEELRGQALRGDDNAGEAVYTIPKDLEFELSDGTLFPMGHTLAVLSNIKQGKKFFKSAIFDGSDEEGPVEINVFIGKPQEALDIEDSSDLDSTLLNTPARRIRLAFFPLNKPSETSDYEMALTFHENGVIRDMIVEYDDFTLSQNLVALEKLDASCEGETAEE